MGVPLGLDLACKHPCSRGGQNGGHRVGLWVETFLSCLAMLAGFCFCFRHVRANIIKAAIAETLPCPSLFHDIPPIRLLGAQKQIPAPNLVAYLTKLPTATPAALKPATRARGVVAGADPVDAGTAAAGNSGGVQNAVQQTPPRASLPTSTV